MLSSVTSCSNLLIPSLRVKKSFKMGLTGCPKMSVRNFHFMLQSIPEDYRSYMCVCVVEGTLLCSQQPVTVRVCGGGHTIMFTTACHCVCGKGAHYHVHNSLSLSVCGGGHTTMFTTACHCMCVWWGANYHVHNSLSLCVCGKRAHYHVHYSLSLRVCVCVRWGAHYHVQNSLSLYVCVVGGTLSCSQQPVTVCMWKGGTLPCSLQRVTVCVWWRAHYHVHNSLSLSVCGGGHTTMFTTACHCVCVCVCVCGGRHTTMFTTACHCMCVCRGGQTIMFTTARHFLCVVGGTLPCSQQPVTVCVRGGGAHYHFQNSLSLCVYGEGAHYHVHNSLSVCVCMVGGTVPC